MSREATSPCPNCGKEIKSAGHIMAQCLASHRLHVKENREESQKRPSFNTMLVNLRRVPMSQFMRNAVKEMEQLPFLLTRDGRVVAIVGPFKGSES